MFGKLSPLCTIGLMSNGCFFFQAEADLGGLTRRIQLLEVDYEQTASRLSTASGKLDEASKLAEEAERLATDKSALMVEIFRLFRLL
jgi:hypothetical protein